MDPISTSIVQSIGSEALSRIASRFAQRAREDWLERRGREFWSRFQRSVAEDSGVAVSGAALDGCLEELLRDETKMEVVSEAARSAFLSKSRTVGPRVIALLAARIVLEDRTATANEELVLDACEALSDSDLRSLRDYLADRKASRDGQVRAYVTSEARDTTFSFSSAKIGPPDLTREIGPWANKLEAIGLFHQEVEESLEEERGTSQTSFDSWLVISAAAMKLAALVDRVDSDPIQP